MFLEKDILNATQFGLIMLNETMNFLWKIVYYIHDLLSKNLLISNKMQNNGYNYVLKGLIWSKTYIRLQMMYDTKKVIFRLKNHSFQTLLDWKQW